MLKFQRGETVYYKEIPNDMYNWQPVIKAYRVLTTRNAYSAG